MGGPGPKRSAWLLLAASCLLACGRTEQACRTCSDAAADAGASGAGGAGAAGGASGSGGAVGAGGSFGAAGSAQAGSGGLPLWECSLGGPEAPLTRYSAVDLAWTLDAVIGPGPSFPPDVQDRSELGFIRTASFPFVQSLVDVARARAQAALIEESELAVCPVELDDRRGCVDTWIRERGLRLYRRPLTEEQVSGYSSQFQQLVALGPALDAARAVLMTMLLSPYFVFRIELGSPETQLLESPPRPGGSPIPPSGTALGAFEVAARLSHFLTRRAPDAALLDSAASAAILQQSGLVEQVDRLLQSPEARTARTLQHLEWLHLEDLGVPPDTTELGPQLRTQVETFIDDVLQHRRGSLRELLSSPRQPLNRSLAERYGIALELGDTFQLVELNPTYYAGVLTQGAWLARSPRPTLRGVRVHDRLLCAAPPPPPFNVPTDGLIGATPRERILNATRGDPTCSTCHATFDPAGFALEAFDERGRLTGFDTSGELRVIEQAEPLPLAGPPQLGEAIAASWSGRACAARRSLEHLLERRFDLPDDARWFDCLTQFFPEGDLDLNHLARLVAISDAMLRTSRPLVSALGVSDAADPLKHAMQETEGLMTGFPDAADRAALGQYLLALEEFQQGLPQP